MVSSGSLDPSSRLTMVLAKLATELDRSSERFRDIRVMTAIGDGLSVYFYGTEFNRRFFGGVW